PRAEAGRAPRLPTGGARRDGPVSMHGLDAVNVQASETQLVVQGRSLAARWLTPQHLRGDAVIVFLHDALGSIEQWKDFPERLCALAELRGLVFDRLGH